MAGLARKRGWLGRGVEQGHKPPWQQQGPAAGLLPRHAGLVKTGYNLPAIVVSQADPGTICPPALSIHTYLQCDPPTHPADSEENHAIFWEAPVLCRCDAAVAVAGQWQQRQPPVPLGKESAACLVPLGNSADDDDCKIRWLSKNVIVVRTD